MGRLGHQGCRQGALPRGWGGWVVKAREPGKGRPQGGRGALGHCTQWGRLKGASLHLPGGETMGRALLPSLDLWGESGEHSPALLNLERTPVPPPHTGSQSQATSRPSGRLEPEFGHSAPWWLKPSRAGHRGSLLGGCTGTWAASTTPGRAGAAWTQESSAQTLCQSASGALSTIKGETAGLETPMRPGTHAS